MENMLGSVGHIKNILGILDEGEIGSSGAGLYGKRRYRRW